MSRKTKKRMAALVVAVALVTCIGVAAVWGRSAQQSARASRAFERGTAAYEAKDFETALNEFSTYIARHRDDADTMYKFADCRRRVEQANGRHFVSAAMLAREAASLQPDDPRPLELLLELYARVGYSNELYDTGARLLEIDPGHRLALEAVVLASTQLDDTSLAQSHLDAWTARHPTDVEVLVLAEELMSFGASPEAAITRVTDLCARFPDDPRPLLLLAALHARQGDIDATNQSLQAAADMTAPNVDTMIVVANFLDRMIAFAMLEDTERQGISTEQYLNAHASGAFSNATTAYTIIRSWKRGANPDLGAVADIDLTTLTTGLVGWLAFVAHMEGVGGGPLLAELRERDAESWKSLIMAMAELDAGSLPEARESLRIAMAEDPSQYAIHFVLARLEIELGDWRSAVARLEAISESDADPLWVHPAVARARTLLQNRQFDEARWAAESAAAFLSTSGQVSMELYLIWTDAVLDLPSAPEIRAERLRTARTQLESVVDEMPAFAPALVRLSKIHAALNDEPALIATLDQLIAQGSALSATELTELWARIHQTHPLAGDQLLDLARDRFADHPSTVFARAVKLFNDGDPSMADQMLMDAIESATNDPLPYLRVAARYFDVRQPDRAREICRIIVEEHPTVTSGQIEVLGLRTSWQEEPLIRQAIGNLRRIAGDGSASWRIAEARALLAFSDEESADEDAAQVAEVLRPILLSQPGNPIARVLAAKADLVLEDRDAALRNLSIATDSNTQDSQLFLQLIEVLQDAGRSEEAARRLTTLLEHTSLSVDARRDRARLLARQGMWDEAIIDYEHVAETGLEADLLRLAELYSLTNRRAEAARIFDELISNEATSSKALRSASDFILTDDPERSLALLERAIAVDPALDGARVRALFYERVGHVDEARALLVTRTREQASSDAWRDLVQFYVRQNEFELASIAVTDGLVSHEDDPMLLAFKGYLKDDEGLQADALAEFLLQLSSENDSPVLRAISQALEDSGDLDRFTKRLEAIVAEFPRSFEAWTVLIGAHRKNGDAEEAINTARAAMRAIPGDPRPARMTVELLMSAGRPAAALGAAQEWHDRSLGDRFLSRMALATIHSRLGDATAALAILEPMSQTIVDRADKFPGDLQLLAGSLAAAGRVEEAHELMWPRAQADLPWLARFVTVASVIPASHASLRRQWFEEAAEYAFDDPEALRIVFGTWHAPAYAEQNTEDLARLADLGNRVLEINEPNAALCGMVASCHSALGNTDEAIRLYRAAIEIDDTDPNVLNNLAYLIYSVSRDSGSRRQLAEASARARLATEISESMTIEPEIRREYYDTLGLILLELADAPSALKVFEAGIAIANSAHLQLGRARSLLAMEDTSGALAALNDAERIALLEDRPTSFLDGIRSLRDSIESELP